MAHPEIPPAIPLLPLHDPEHCGHATLALRRELRMQVRFVVAIGDVDPLVAGYGVRVDGGGRGDTVLPFFLHLGVHYQEGVVGKVDGDLAGCVACFFFGFGI